MKATWNLNVYKSDELEKINQIIRMTYLTKARQNVYIKYLAIRKIFRKSETRVKWIFLFLVKYKTDSFMNEKESTYQSDQFKKYVS